MKLSIEEKATKAREAVVAAAYKVYDKAALQADKITFAAEKVLAKAEEAADKVYNKSIKKGK
jgi:hypothetical protein